MSETAPILTMVRDYIESDPASAARTLEAMSEGEAAAVTHLLRRDLKARVIPHLQISFAAGLLKGVSEKDFEAVARAMQPERAAAGFGKHLDLAIGQHPDYFAVLGAAVDPPVGIDRNVFGSIDLAERK